MNLRWITPKRLVSGAVPLIVLAAVACGQAVSTVETPAPAATTAPVASEQVIEKEDSAQTIQTLLEAEGDVKDVSTPATAPAAVAAAPSPEAAQPPQIKEPEVIAPSVSETQVIDPDAVVEAFETVIGRVHDEVLPSVVRLRVSQRVSASDSSPFGIPSPFGPSPPQGDSPPQDFFFRNGEGSGFVWDDKGHIVTNQHVIANADEIIAIFADGTEANAEIVGEDPDSDLAVIKVDLPAEKLSPVKLGDSGEVSVGQLAIAIGSPFGQEFTTTVGIVSAIGRTIRSGNTPFSVPRVIQTDAPINPGNSGGPLLDRSGNVIGINTQIISRSGANTGIGFAVPINTVKQVVPVLIEDGDFSYAWLGISGSTLRPEVAKLMDIPADVRGAQVMALADGGPAEKAGLRASDRNKQTEDGLIPVGGDVIVAIDGTAITSMDDLIIYLIDNTRPGDVVIFDVVREGGEQAQIEVTLGTRPDSIN